MTIKDFTLLGWTAPHPTKRNGACVCAAGYSKTLDQFLRIYPLPFPFKTNFGRWDQLQVPLVRNDLDSRNESWKIKYDSRTRDELANLLVKTGRVKKENEFGWLWNHLSDSIDHLNSEQCSVGIIRPKKIYIEFKNRPAETSLVTDMLFPDMRFTLKQSPFIPQLKIINQDGSTNRLQLLEWGCCEYLRRNPDGEDSLWKALLLDRPDYEHLVFVGNHNRHRTAWLGIALIAIKRDASKQLSLF